MNRHRKKNTTTYISILFIITGAIFIINVVDDPNFAADDMQWSAAAFSILAILAPIISIVAIKNEIYRNEIVILIGVFYWLLFELLQPSFVSKTLSFDMIRNTYISISIFIAGVVIGSAFEFKASRFVSNASSQRISADQVFKFGMFFSFIGLFRYVHGSGYDIEVVINNLLSPRFTGLWNIDRSVLGTVIKRLSNFGYVVPPLTCAYYFINKKFDLKFFLLMALSLIIMAFVVQTGARRIVGAIFIMVLAVIWLYTTHKNIWNKIAMLLPALAGILIILEYILLFRNKGFGQFQAERIFEVDYFRVDSNFYYLSWMIEFIPNAFDYQYFDYIYYVLSRPIPRFLWPGKPDGLDFSLSNAMGFKGVNFSTTVIGELYLSYDLIAVFIGGLLLGMLASYFNSIIKQATSFYAIILSAIASAMLFVAVRSLQDLFLISIPLSVWLIFAKTPLYSTLQSGLKKYIVNKPAPIKSHQQRNR